MNLQQRLRVALGVLAVFVITSQPITAQQTTSSKVCEAFVRTAMSQVGSNCAGLGQNEVCYGFENAAAFDIEGSSDPAFNEPGQRIQMTDVAVIQTSSLNLANNTWGIAPISIQANLPVALSGKGVILVPIGDVEIESALQPRDALILPEEALPIVTRNDVDLFAEPSTSEQPIGQVADGMTLLVDGISLDSQWLRTYFEYQREYSVRATAWVSRNELDSMDVDGLPVIASDSKTPMQSFFFRNSFEESPCLGTPPSLLYIQGPRTIETNITVNGADIRISSTIALRMLPNNIMRLIVLSGITTLNADTDNPIIVPAGFMAETCVSDDGVIDQTECNWSVPSPITLSILEELRPLQNLPANVMNYQLSLPGLVCPSGVGNPICEIIFNDNQLIPILRSLCDQNILPTAVCRVIGGIEIG